MTGSNRREFCRNLLAGSLGLSLASRSFAQSSIAVTKIDENFSLITGAGNNVVLLNTPDGALLVDSGTAERSADLMKVVAEQTGGKPVEVLFNTHWHQESTGGNDRFASESKALKIVAHENTRLWMTTEFHVQWQNRTYKPRAKQAHPNQTFYTTGKMTFGKHEIQYGHLGQAHTDGDIYLLFPQANILVAGDIFTVGKYPILDWSTGGWIGARGEPAGKPCPSGNNFTVFVGRRAEDILLSLTNAQTKVIPASGPVQTQAELKDLQKMMETVRVRFYDFIGSGFTPAQMFRAAPTKEFDAKWGDPTQFISNVYPGLWNHVRELGCEAKAIV
jgi:glyoxylase-like metal-dependent hydrolase (beta-lactamase superfamily II)